MKKILLLIVSIALSPFIAEAVFRVYAQIKYHTPITSNRELKPHEIIQSNPHRKLQYELRPNLDVKYMGTRIITNSFGMRSPEFRKRKDPKTFRIIALGDSVMFGWGIAENRHYIDRVRSELNKWIPQNSNYQKVEVINAAVPGYNTVAHYYLLRDYYLKLKPDLIIWGFVGNDVENRIDYSNPIIDTDTESYFLKYILSLKLIVKTKPDIIHFFPDFRPTGSLEKFNIRFFKDAFFEIFKITSEHKVPIVMLLDSRYENHNFKQSWIEKNGIKNRARVVNLFRIIRSENHTLKEIFQMKEGRDHAGTYQIKNDGHPNELWHKIAADFLNKEIKSLFSAMN